MNNEILKDIYIDKDISKKLLSANKTDKMAVVDSTKCINPLRKKEFLTKKMSCQDVSGACAMLFGLCFQRKRFFSKMDQ